MDSRSEGSGVPAWNKLRIDADDASPLVEYPIEDNGVDRRTVEAAAETSRTIEVRWQRLIPAELTFNVIGNTVVAHWLLRRMGVHALVRACNQYSSPVTDGAYESSRAG